MTIKHADLIRAALDGKVIQYKRPHGETWHSFNTAENALTSIVNEAHYYNYRIKPKEDVVKYRAIPRVEGDSVSYKLWNSLAVPAQCGAGIEKITYDGDTGKVKSVELVKEN